MSKYDLPEAPVAREPCAHTFANVKKVRTEYGDDLCEKVINYGREGKRIEAFAGKFNVCVNKMCEWLSNPQKYSAFDSAVKVSQSACIHYWLEELQHAISACDWQAVAQIRSILSDLNKYIPKELSEGLFNNLKQRTADDLARENELKTEEGFFSALGGKSE